MANTTISRTAYNALVDDDGSGLTGSVWDKADVDDILDAIDALFSSASGLNINGPLVAAGNVTGYHILPEADNTRDVGSSSTWFRSLYAKTGIFERGRSAAIGEVTSVSYASGNFTASGSMTWTVESGDQVAYKYMVIGKIITVWFTLNTTTVGGTLSTELRIKIPGGFTAKSTDTLSAIRAHDNGTETVGFCGTVAAANYIRCWRSGFSNWATSTNNTTVQGMAVFEVE